MKTKLVDSELKVMDVIWKEGEATAKHISDIINQKYGWNINTTYTLIKRCIKKGAVARKQCEVSCIGCGICEKTCTAGAIHVEDNCAVIDEEICLSCGMCSVKCPRHVIHDLRGVFTAVR